MLDKKKYLSWGEVCSRTLRSWKLWWGLSKSVFLSRLSAAAAKTVVPYLNIYMTAKIISGMADGTAAQTIWSLVAVTLALNGALSLLAAALGRWVNVQAEAEEYLDYRVYADKMLDLDFQDMDRQEIYEMYANLYDTVQWTGWGTMLTPVWFEELVRASVRVLGGVLLAVSMFTLPVPESGGWLTLLNEPLWIFVIVLVLTGLALLSPLCAHQAQRHWTDASEEWKTGNRFGLYFSTHVNEDRKRALDLRIYEQQENICSHYIAQDASANKIFGRLARGPMGFWMAASKGMSALLMGAIYFFVCLKAWAGAYGIGAVTQYVGAVTNLFLGLSQLLQVMEKLRTNAEFLEENLNFLEYPNSMYRGGLTTEKRSDLQYDVEFRDVSFQYPGTDCWVLRHVSLKFRIGARLAIVGENGSGKTTFIKLLCRLYDPTEGQILLNGIDIRKYRYEDYIRIFSVVFQDFRLFSLPLGQNVAGSVKYDEFRVMDCLEKAGFQTASGRMPHGMDTYLYKELDAEGVDVSGGEAQKIAIARALYRDAPFLILDEPTAALDPVTEAEIYSQLNEIAGEHTAVYISHRLSSCRFCQEIAVFDRGRIVQHGSHEKLLEDRGGKYYELWHTQAQYYQEQNCFFTETTL